jgi:hypothetical protein
MPALFVLLGLGCVGYLTYKTFFAPPPPPPPIDGSK